jgi:predicted phage terminase large subunit-like protein
MMTPYAIRAKAELERRRRVPQASTTPPMPLYEFIRAAWHVIEPGTVYADNWHIAAIAAHLTAVTNGEIRDLIINMPPRFMKSTIVSVMWPVWTWTFKPSMRWLTGSYAMPLSIRDALKSRRLIRSSWFQSRYASVFRLTGDQNQKSRYENDKSGYRLATSTGASTTGEGGDALILDDPHNVRQAESDVQRQSTLDWIDTTWSTRRNDPKRSARVVVMQRLHEEDATGHLLVQGGWEHLCLPQEYEPMVQVSGIGWSDPRTQEGELLWPERFGPVEVAAAKRELGSYGYAGQHQQSPQPKGGGTFKREWWGRYREVPMSITRVALFVDSAFKEGVENDYSVCAAWGTDGMGTYYVLDVWRDKLSYPKLMQALHDQYAKHRHWAVRVGSLALVIEDKASGQSAIQTLSLPLPTMTGVLPALPVLAWDAPSGMSKQARAEGVTPTIEAGRVLLPLSAEWVEDFLVEHEKFPAGAHDDQVDTTSMALMYFAGGYDFGPLADDIVRELQSFTGV